MPNQLYYDSKTTVKNAIFCVAKQQKLNPASTFSLLDLGDNALELTFALMCMSGGHNNAFNYQQVIVRLCAVCDIGDIYSHNPHIHHGHRCLNMNCKESVDHISHANWVGNTAAANCNLPSCWHQGKEKVLDILWTSKVLLTSYDFDVLFTSGSGIDMLCVFGDAKYPSINDTEDNKDVVDACIPLTAQTTTENDPCLNGTDTGNIQGEIDAGGSRDGPEDKFIEINFDEAIENELDALDHDPAIVSINHLETDAPSATMPPSGPGVCAEDYLWCNDHKWVHKQSVCHLILTPDFSPKSTVWLLRVQGYTSANKRLNDIEMGQILHGDHFVVGDVFLSLVRTHNKALGLAFICSTHIAQGGSVHGHIKTAMLMSPQGRIKVTGDIMVLWPSVTSPIPSSDSLWLWTGGYLKAALMVPGTEVKTTCVVSVSVAGHLITVMNPSMAAVSACLAPKDQSEVNANDTTWALTTKVLEMAIALLCG